MSAGEYLERKRRIDEASNDEFVRCWVVAVRNRIGLKGLCNVKDWDYTTTSARATALRNAGVKLPTMPKAGQKRNVLEVNADELNKIIVDELGEEALNWRNR